jgi:ribosome modulation factor
MSNQETTHPFHQGYEARLSEMTDNDNPYPECSKDYSAWLHGWDQADEDCAKP